MRKDGECKKLREFLSKGWFRRNDAIMQLTHNAALCVTRSNRHSKLYNAQNILMPTGGNRGIMLI